MLNLAPELADAADAGPSVLICRHKRITKDAGPARAKVWLIPCSDFFVERADRTLSAWQSHPHLMLLDRNRALRLIQPLCLFYEGTGACRRGHRILGGLKLVHT